MPPKPSYPGTSYCFLLFLTFLPCPHSFLAYALPFLSVSFSFPLFSTFPHPCLPPFLSFHLSLVFPSFYRGLFLFTLSFTFLTSHSSFSFPLLLPSFLSFTFHHSISVSFSFVFHSILPPSLFSTTLLSVYILFLSPSSSCIISLSHPFDRGYCLSIPLYTHHHPSSSLFLSLPPPSPSFPLPSHSSIPSSFTFHHSISVLFHSPLYHFLLPSSLFSTNLL